MLPPLLAVSLPFGLIFSVLIGGIAGALLTGVFAVEQYGGTAGVLEGNVGQLFNQCVRVAIVFVYDAVASLIILFAIKIFVGLRDAGHRARRSRPRAARRSRTVVLSPR
jgi:ammonia channel protein AmtB